MASRSRSPHLPRHDPKPTSAPAVARAVHPTLPERESHPPADPRLSTPAGIRPQNLLALNRVVGNREVGQQLQRMTTTHIHRILAQDAQPQVHYIVRNGAQAGKRVTFLRKNRGWYKFLNDQGREIGIRGDIDLDLVLSGPGSTSTAPQPQAQAAPVAVGAKRKRTTRAGKADPPKKQRRGDTWVFLAAVNEPRSRDAVYWDREKLPMPAVIPGIARHLRLRVSSTKLPEDGRIEMTEQQYIAYVNGGASSSGSRTNTYNPFGRFNPNLTRSAYLTWDGEQLSTRTVPDGHGKITEKGGNLGTTHMPAWVEVDHTATRLSAIAIDPLGVTYGDGPPLPQSGLPATSQQVRRPRPIPDRARLSGLESQSSVRASSIDTSTLGGYRGMRGGEQSQISIMGVSAGEMAKAAGYDEAIDPEFANDTTHGGKLKHGWQWLHMISYALGGPTATGPQVATNLVVGTTAANTAMIMVEDAIKALITDRIVASAKVHVKALMANEEYRIAGTLVYSVMFRLQNGQRLPLEFNFSALTTATPYVATNMYLRQAVKELIRSRSAEATERPPIFD